MKTKEGKPFIGISWPGRVIYFDYLNPKAREYWSSLYSVKSYKETTNEVFIWNDMNEPSVFEAFESTIPKSCT